MPLTFRDCNRVQVGICYRNPWKTTLVFVGGAMTQRFHDVGQTIYHFGSEFLVRCPRCGKCAHVTRLTAPQSNTFGFQELFDPRRCVCPNCAYVKEWRESSVSIGGAVDWYFSLPLWLQTPCCGHILWAYNAEHRAFLEAYVQAKLRDQLPSANTNRAITSRLPLWLQSAQNREDVLKGLTRLKRMLE